MTFWTYANLAAVTHGTWLVEPDDLDAQVTGLWHDTREITQGQAYLAIKGENFDGHAFVGKAFDAGAALAIVQTKPATSDQPPAPLLLVEDTVKALQDFARAYRDELKAGGCKVIGIAGSNGKTTTRHLIHHVLTHAGLKGTQSPKSFNNHLGVPLTLLSAKPQDDFVAAEIGTNHPGEIDFLSAIARPDIAVITSIGEEHLEFFKDLEGVAKEEAYILQHVFKGGFGVMDDGVLEAVTPYVDWTLTPEIMTLECFGGDFMPDWEPLAGPFLRHNMALAGEVAVQLGVSVDQVKQALQSVKPVAGRMQQINLGQGITVLHDAYNANPSSMQATVEWFGMLSHKDRKVIVVGDMLELGDASALAHRALGELLSGLDELRPLIAVGPLCTRFVPEFQHVDLLLTELDDGGIDRVLALLQPGDTVLLKASRGMALERLIPAIERRFGSASSDQPT